MYIEHVNFMIRRYILSRYCNNKPWKIRFACFTYNLVLYQRRKFILESLVPKCSCYIVLRPRLNYHISNDIFNIACKNFKQLLLLLILHEELNFKQEERGFRSNQNCRTSICRRLRSPRKNTVSLRGIRTNRRPCWSDTVYRSGHWENRHTPLVFPFQPTQNISA